MIDYLSGPKEKFKYMVIIIDFFSRKERGKCKA